jgi:hypothetical protein
VEFEVGQHVLLKIHDLKMLDGLTPHFNTKYTRPYEILHKLHPNVYTMKLPSNFVSHLTFHILKLKSLLCDGHKLNWIQKVWLEVNAIEHKLAAEIKGIFCARQTHLKSKKYLVKYKGCHHKEAMWMKPTHLNHVLEMVNKFESKRVTNLGWK